MLAWSGVGGQGQRLVGFTSLAHFIMSPSPLTTPHPRAYILGKAFQGRNLSSNTRSDIAQDQQGKNVERVTGCRLALSDKE